MSQDAGTAEATIKCNGFTTSRFDLVRDAFESSLRTGEEAGGSVAVYHRGQLVVDLWGGATEDGIAYQEDALHVGYSVTKGVLGLLLAHLVDTGELRLDEPVAAHWPQFAAQGKADVTIRELASHQAGLAAFSDPIQIEDLADWELCTQRLALQEPAWPARSGHGYHALTLGYLLGEVVLRATGRTVGRLLQERLNPDGDLQAWIGLDGKCTDRVVRYTEAAPTPGVGRVMETANTSPGTHTFAAFNNPPITIDTFNAPALWSPEIPAANGVFDARSLARLYSSVVDGSLRSISRPTVEDVRTQQVYGPDLVLVDQPTRFGTVFMLSSTRQPMLGNGSFGHDGMGGHIAFADPESGIAFAYLTTRAIPDPPPHSRMWRLLSAVIAGL